MFLAEAASPSTEMPHSGGEPGTPMGSVVGASGELAGLSPEEAELKRAEWSQELARVEEEIGMRIGNRYGNTTTFQYF